MASKKVEALIDAFRNHFRKGEDANIPVALRQEPVDVVYRSLLEEDKPASAPLTPLMSEPAMPDLDMGMGLGDMGGMGGMEEMMGALGGLDMGLPQQPPEMGAEPGLPTSVDDFLTEF